jgi:hypothetical protein
MRLSELLGAEVHDGKGRILGAVRDVRFVQDGPEIPGFGPGLRVQGLLVGNRPADRFGLTRTDVKGPWLLKMLSRRIERRLRFVEWDRVHSVSAHVVEIRSPR